MVALVDAMQSGKVDATPALVLSNRADAGGLIKAQERGVPTEVVDHRPHKDNRAAFDALIQKELEVAKTDIVCLAGFMRIFTPEFMNGWAGRIINIHPSLLPKYKGLNTHQRALDAGDSVAGCTVHEATAVLDDGPILGQTEVPILKGDTAETLAARVLKEEHKLYPPMLAKFVDHLKS